MALPIHKREFDIFLSHAHKDKEFVDTLYHWLSNTAGLSVWYDSQDMGGGSLLASDLQNAIERCKGVLLLVSDDSLKQGWVLAEYNSSMDERANFKDFRVVGLRIGDANTQGLMKGITWINIPDLTLNEESAYSILASLYPSKNWPNPAKAKDVYISCSWRPEDYGSVKTVCESLVEQGLRLVGDSKNQEGFSDGDRVQKIIASCGAFVCIIPYRSEDVAEENRGPYKYFFAEIKYAKEVGIPSIIIADPRVRAADNSDSNWLRMENNSSDIPADVEVELESVWGDWIEPSKVQYIFCAMDLNSNAVLPTRPVRKLVELVTGMCTVVGNEIQQQPLNTAVMNSVCNAFVVIADISEDNINSCIEAGMALAVGANVHLVSRGITRRPPFMLRAVQMPSYKDDVERIGLLHNIIRPYRRRILNVEI